MGLDRRVFLCLILFALNTTDSPLSVNGKSNCPPASGLFAAAAAADITPADPQFLWGYPHVARMSTGVHDPLLASALYLGDGATGILFVGCDVLVVSNAIASRARRRIEAVTGVPASHIVVSATHTHSGPKTANTLGQEADPVVPLADEAYLQKLEDGIVEAGSQAWRERVPAEAGFAVADGRGVGTNRHDPDGPCDLRVPVLMVRALDDMRPLGLMLTVCMHPTVLHEDSTLISADFPGFARQDLQRSFPGCPVIYHMGPSGNQSPRHVTRANTFEEAGRLGEILGSAVRSALENVRFTSSVPLVCLTAEVALSARAFPSSAEAATALAASHSRLEALRQAGAPRAEVRTAECDWFGAEKTLVLARAAESGKVQEALAVILPAKIQVIGIGPCTYVAWPGEIFVEFGLEVARHRSGTHVISLANGTLHGYLVTQEAVERGSYEAGNALLSSPASGEQLVRATLELLDRLPSPEQRMPIRPILFT
jgi:neutral ceramidase